MLAEPPQTTVSQELAGRAKSLSHVETIDGRRRILSTSASDSADSSARRRTHGRETTCSKRIPEKRRRVGGRLHLGRCGAGARAAGPGAAADDQGREGGRDCLWRPVEVRHLGPHPARRQTLARHLRPHVSCRDPASGFGRGHHAVLAPLLRDDARRLPSGYRSQTAHADDPRPGGPSADVHRGRPEAPPVRDAPALHRVRRQPSVAPREDGAGNARHDEQCRMDRRAPVHAAQGVRPERQRHSGSSPRARKKSKARRACRSPRRWTTASSPTA